MAKFLNWLLTDKGKQFVGGSAVAFSTCVYLGQLAPHTYFVTHYKGVMQMYNKNGFEQPLSEDLKIQANEVLKKCNLLERQQDLVRFFTVFGFDTLSVGSSNLKSGAYVGIPFNFTYLSINDIDTHTIRVGAKPCTFNTALGEEFLQSLVLSHQAKNFAIARDIFSVTTNQVHIQSFFPGFLSLGLYFTGVAINRKFKLFGLPLAFRLLMYSILGSIGAVTYLGCNDLIQTHYEAKSDRKAGALGLDYVRGGIEYYDHILRRNKCLRVMLEEEGEQLFTYHGNQNSFIRTKTLPLTERLEKLKAMEKKIVNAAKDSSPDKKDNV